MADRVARGDVIAFRPFYVTATDAPVLTTGVLPPAQEAMRHSVRGAGSALDKLGLTEAVERTGAEIGGVPSGPLPASNELCAEIARRIGRSLPTRRARRPRRDGHLVIDHALSACPRRLLTRRSRTRPGAG